MRIFDVMTIRRGWVEHAQCNTDKVVVLTSAGPVEFIHEVDEYEERVKEYEESTIEGGSLFDRYEDE